jgi:hypothetical protein
MNRTPPLKHLSLLFLIVITGYLFTLNPALFRNDSPETIVGCMTLGVTHPPGYPLFNLLGRLFYLHIGNPAFSYNFLAALLGTLGCCLLYANVWLLIENAASEDSLPAHSQNTAAFTAALCLAFSQGYWGNAITAKGAIYILQVVLELALFFTWQLFSQNPSIKHTAILFFWFSLGLTNHWPTIFLLLPALVLTLAIQKNAQTKIEYSKILLNITIIAITLSLYLYLPLRAINYPPINFDNPFNWRNFTTVICRTEYTKIEFTGNTPSAFATTIGPKAAYISNHLLTEFMVFAYFLALLGTVWLFRKNQKAALFLVFVLFFTIASSLIYLNVEPIEYWHMDDHLLSSNWILAILTGLGAHYMLRSFEGVHIFKHRLTLVFVLFIGPFVFWNNLKNNDQKHRFLYYGYGITTLQTMPANTLFFAESDYDYFSLLYLKNVLHKRPDTHLFSMPFLSKPDEERTLKRTEPLVAANLDTDVFKSLESENQAKNPIVTMFPNGSFSKEYLKDFQKLTIHPLGLAVLISTPGLNPGKEASYRSLTDFWVHYAEPSVKDPRQEEALLRQTCALPYLNEAYFMKIEWQATTWTPTKDPTQLEKIQNLYATAALLYGASDNQREAFKALFNANSWLNKN